MRSSVVIGTLLVLSIAVAAYEAVTYYYGFVIGRPFYWCWALVYSLLLLYWLHIDAEQHTEMYRPYEFTFLAFVFWFPYFPYYLLRTRRAKGLLLFLGVIALPYLGYLLQWLIYVVR